MARLHLSPEEERRMEEALSFIDADTHAGLAAVRDGLTDPQWEIASAFFRSSVRLHLEARLMLDTLIRRATELNLSPAEPGLSQFKEQITLDTYLLTDIPLSGDVLDTFERPSPDRRPALDWLGEHNITTPTMEDWKAAEQATGITAAMLEGANGGNLFIDLISKLEDEAEERFFGNVDAELRDLLT